MKHYLLATLLTCTAALWADGETAQAPKTPYEKTILAILAFGVNNNKNVYNNAQLLEIAQKHKDEKNKIKKLFMIYFGDKNERYKDQMQNDQNHKEVIRIFLKSIGKNANDNEANEILEMQISSAPNNMVEEVLKGAIEEAKISPEELNALADYATKLSAKVSVQPATTAA